MFYMFFICFYMCFICFSYVSHMFFIWFSYFSYVFHMFCICFLYEFICFYMILYCFCMILFSFFLWFLEVGPQFSNDPFFLTINVWPDFEHSTGNWNVRPEIPTTTEIVQWPIFVWLFTFGRILNVRPELRTFDRKFERSTGNYHRKFPMTRFFTINVWPDFERSTGNSNVRQEIRTLSVRPIFSNVPSFLRRSWRSWNSLYPRLSHMSFSLLFFADCLFFRNSSEFP